MGLSAYMCSTVLVDDRLVLNWSVCVQAKDYGPTMSGMMFGCGWWFWVDAAMNADRKPPFVQVGMAVFSTQRSWVMVVSVLHAAKCIE